MAQMCLTETHSILQSSNSGKFNLYQILHCIYVQIIQPLPIDEYLAKYLPICVHPFVLEQIFGYSTSSFIIMASSVSSFLYGCVANTLLVVTDANGCFRLTLTNRSAEILGITKLQ